MTILASVRLMARNGLPWPQASLNSNAGTAKTSEHREQ
jgi:hypothetical protein